jgi:hypothetical protein
MGVAATLMSASVTLRPIVPSNVAAPVPRLIVKSCAPVGQVNEANDTLVSGEMSKPTRSLVLKPSAPTVFIVPAFGGLCVARMSRLASMAKSVVVVAPAKLFV